MAQVVAKMLSGPDSPGETIVQTIPQFVYSLCTPRTMSLALLRGRLIALVQVSTGHFNGYPATQ